MIIPTKLHIPLIRSATVSRPRLMDRLNEGLECELTLVTAPAGYGKTTVLSEWANAIQVQVAWVSLDSEDNDFMRFWEHTIAALEEACMEFDGQNMMRIAAADASGSSLVAALINGLHRVSETIVLIWDDFHHIEEGSILKHVVNLLEHLPNHIHLYMACRVPPALPITRIRARCGLNRLEVNELRFEAEETAAFFNDCSKLVLDSNELAAVQERTEGWVAGMRLAALSLDEQTGHKALMKKFSGTERDIAGYFLEEVLFRQTESVRQFLLQTSVLDRLSGELCAEVTGMTDSASILHELEEKGLFLVPLDDQYNWYRYHHLFQQFLYEQLKRNDVQ